jgi:hypothetical protein
MVILQAGSKFGTSSASSLFLHVMSLCGSSLMWHICWAEQAGSVHMTSVCWAQDLSTWCLAAMPMLHCHEGILLMFLAYSRHCCFLSFQGGRRLD